MKEGAMLERSGKRVGKAGLFIKPTVFMVLTPSMAIVKEEIFGTQSLLLLLFSSHHI